MVNADFGGCRAKGKTALDFYGLKSCDTCRKAQKALLAQGVELNVVDVRSDGVPPEKLAEFANAFGDALINRKSTTWRGLDDTQRQENPITLLQAHPTLMKRPVIKANGQFYLGWGEEVQKALLG